MFIVNWVFIIITHWLKELPVDTTFFVAREGKNSFQKSVHIPFPKNKKIKEEEETFSIFVFTFSFSSDSI